MPITDVTIHRSTAQLTVVADLPVSRQELWDAYLDPRQIERFWGPPGWPATFFRHDGAAGGKSLYSMTGPDGDRSSGYWEWLEVDAPRSFSVQDGFATENGAANSDLPSMRMVFTFDPCPTGSRVTITTHFNSRDELEQLLGMGMEEGMRAAMGQIDEVIADTETFKPNQPTLLQHLSETQVRITRVVRGEITRVWAAHVDADQLRRWMLGPDGWSMPICEIPQVVGERYRNGWKHDQGPEEFGFTGILKEFSPPYRMVSTEAMWTPEDPEAAHSPVTINELTLTPVEQGTLASVVITYPDAATLEMILATGMVQGMEESYARLEREILT